MSELPRGTVSFLFTDMEGSTRLLKHLGADYGGALAEHQRILRAAFAAHSGRGRGYVKRHSRTLAQPGAP